MNRERRAELKKINCEIDTLRSYVQVTYRAAEELNQRMKDVARDEDDARENMPINLMGGDRYIDSVNASAKLWDTGSDLNTCDVYLFKALEALDAFKKGMEVLINDEEL